MIIVVGGDTIRWPKNLFLGIVCRRSNGFTGSWESGAQISCCRDFVFKCRCRVEACILDVVGMLQQEMWGTGAIY